MSQISEFVIIKIITEKLRSVISAGVELPFLPRDFQVCAESDIAPRERPCLVVSAESGVAVHPRLIEFEVTVSLLTQRDDVDAEVAAEWMSSIDTYLHLILDEIISELALNGLIMKAWSKVLESQEADEKRGGVAYVTFRAVLMNSSL